MTTEVDHEKLVEELAQFCGSECLYRHWTNRLKYTEGVKYLAERAGAYWLIDLVASWQIKPKVGREPFQVWVLTVNRNAKREASSEKPEPMAVATCTDDLPGKLLCRQEIEYTDFPLDQIKLYCEQGVLMLPQER
jgi:hypothetical protein